MPDRELMMHAPLIPPRLQPRLRQRQRGYFIIDQYRRGDPYRSFVVQHAHFDSEGSPAPSSWLNSCSRGNSLARTNTYDTTSQFVFGQASRLDNNDGCAFTATHADYQFGTNDFTIEFWFRPDARTLTICFDMRNATATAAAAALSTNTSGDLFYYVSGATRITGSGVITAGAWHAICVCRVGTSTRMYVNGTQRGATWTDTTNYNAAARIYMGSFTSNQRNAYHDELRITNGVGRYSGASYELATEPFPDE